MGGRPCSIHLTPCPRGARDQASGSSCPVYMGLASLKPQPLFHVLPQQLASKDGAVLSVGADVQFRIWDPVLSVMTVKDLNTATRMTAQNAMTKALLKRPLREIQMEKLKISDQLLVGSSTQGKVRWPAPGPCSACQGTLSKAPGYSGPRFTLCPQSVTTFAEPVAWAGL